MAQPTPPAQLAIPPPSGFISCIFTDIIDSTAMWSLSEPATFLAVELHDTILRSSLAQHSGYEIMNLGDGFFCSIASATHALQFCLSAQLALNAATWPKDIIAYRARQDICNEKNPHLTFRGLTVRMGCHYGEIYRELIDPMTKKKDYRGLTAGVASRVQGLGEGSEIAVSDSFLVALFESLTGLKGENRLLNDRHRARILSRVVPAKLFEVRPIGEQWLKGVPKAEHTTLVRLRP